jgi:hypothetical protein
VPGSAAPGAPGTHAEQVTGHSLHDAIDDAIEHVVENDRAHPVHDEVSTASRDEELAGVPVVRGQASRNLWILAVVIALAVAVVLSRLVWR